MTYQAKHPHLIYIVTVPMTVDALLRGQLRALKENGFRVSVIVSPDPGLEKLAQREGVEIISVPMEREISPLKDAVALYKLYRVLRRLKPDLVNASTPKAGLLGMLASRMARVPVRVYQQRGLRLETTHGLKRKILLQAERLTAGNAHYVVCNGPSLKKSYLDLRISRPEKLRVLGAGSSNGINTSRFKPRENEGSDGAQALRHRLGIPEGAQVIGFVGRLTKDKGILDLIEAFDLVTDQQPEVYLLLVGPFEQGDPLPEYVAERLKQDSRIILTDYVEDVACYYLLMDILAFPSYREGFPNVPLEAAASGIPVIGYQATGTIDAILAGKSGCLVPVGDSFGLAEELLRFLQHEELRCSAGLAGRKWVEETFDSKAVWQNWIQFYRDVLRDIV